MDRLTQNRRNINMATYIDIGNVSEKLTVELLAACQMLQGLMGNSSTVVVCVGSQVHSADILQGIFFYKCITFISQINYVSNNILSIIGYSE